jgi:hypothetical protein
MAMMISGALLFFLLVSTLLVYLVDREMEAESRSHS